MPECKDWITYGLTLLTIITTCYFSYAVLKATRKSVDVADATLKLNKHLVEQEEKRIEIEIHRNKEINSVMRNHYITKLIEDTRRAEYSLASTVPLEVLQRLKEAPRTLPIDMQEIAKYFTPDECFLISNAWDTYTEFIDENLKDSYSGDQINVLTTKSGNTLQKLNELINYLNAAPC